MPEAMRRANNAKSKVRARVEHVFAEQKAAWACSSEPSASPERGSRSACQSRLQHQALDVPGTHRSRMNTTPEGAKGRGASREIAAG